MKIALFDIGSNSIRMMLARYEEKQWHYGKKYIWTTQLGKLTPKGDLAEESMQKTLQGIEEGLCLARQEGITHAKAFATSAVREANNGKAFMERLRTQYDLDTHIVSGEEEARYGFLGATALQEAEGLIAVIDIGGSSTEIALGTKEGLLSAVSYPLGAVRLQSLCEKGERAIAEYAHGLWQDSGEMNMKAFAIGGTATTLAAMYHEMDEYQVDKIQGTVLTFSWIQKMRQYIAALSMEARAQIRGLPAKRRDIIVSGMDILLAVMERYGFKEITVSESDGLEGVSLTLTGSLRYPLGKINAELQEAFERDVDAFVQEEAILDNASSVLVACSGGPDSMSLLHYLVERRNRGLNPLHIGAYCLDHGFRLQGWAELEMVRAYCLQEGVSFYGEHVSMPLLAKKEGVSDETMGRLYRKQALTEILRKDGYDVIATAHHKDDQAETILSHLIRGTGLKGLCAMAPKEAGYIRPFLSVRKQDIMRYVEASGFMYAWDHTNDETVYERNKIRHEVLPVLETLNPKVVDALTRVSEIARRDEAYLEASCDAVWLTACIREEEDICVFDSVTLQDESKSMRYRLFRKMAAKYYPYGATPTERHIKAMDEVVFGRHGQQFFVKWMKIWKEYDKIYTARLNTKSIDIAGGVFSKEDNTLYALDTQIGPYRVLESGIQIPLSLVTEKLVIRHRQSGDNIVLCNAKGQCIGHKTLKKYLIDRKVPRHMRDRMLWVASGRLVFCEAVEGKRFTLLGLEEEAYVHGSIRRME